MPCIQILYDAVVKCCVMEWDAAHGWPYLYTKLYTAALCNIEQVRLVASTGWLAALSPEREFYSALQCRVTQHTVVQWIVQAGRLVACYLPRESFTVHCNAG